MGAKNAWKLHAALAAAQAGFAGYEVLIRRALLEGTSIVVLSLYRYCLGFLLLRIQSNVVERKNKPVLSFPALGATLLLGTLGLVTSELCYLQALKYTSPTFASAMRNTIPVFTMVLALAFRLEKVDTEKAHGILKITGTTVILCGWMVLLVYKGSPVLESHFSFLPNGESALTREAYQTVRLGVVHLRLDNQKYGAIFLVISCLSFSIFLILQAFIMENYAAPITFASFGCFFAIVEVGIIACFHNHRRSAWSRFTFIEGMGVLYAGLVVTGLVFATQSWGVKQGGPVIVAAYQPLETLVTVILAFCLLKESIHLGSLIGCLILLCGCYLIIWSKGREQRRPSFIIQDFQGVYVTPEAASELSYQDGNVTAIGREPVMEVGMRSSWFRKHSLFTPTLSMERGPSLTPDHRHMDEGGEEHRLNPSSSSSSDPEQIPANSCSIPLSRQLSSCTPPRSAEMPVTLRVVTSAEADSSDSGEITLGTSRWNTTQAKANSVRSIPSRLHDGVPSSVSPPYANAASVLPSPNSELKRTGTILVNSSSGSGPQLHTRD